jgi:hypothetical protein
MLDPLPVEMSDASLEKIFPDLGAGESRWPLEELYPLLEDLNAALSANLGHPVYNPASNTIADFKWAHVRTHGPGTSGTVQLCAEANTTGKVHAGDTKLIPAPEGKFQGYMVELVNLSKL